jgi:hypothetical protein
MLTTQQAVAIAAGAICLIALLAALLRIGLRRRSRPRVRVLVGPEVASAARVGMVVPVGKRGREAEVVHVDRATGVVELERVTPRSARERGAGRHELALLRALGFDPATHDLQPVLQPWRGVQVLKAGERVRFFTERQVRAARASFDSALRREARA